MGHIPGFKDNIMWRLSLRSVSVQWFWMCLSIKLSVDLLIRDDTSTIDRKRFFIFGWQRKCGQNGGMKIPTAYMWRQMQRFFRLKQMTRFPIVEQFNVCFTNSFSPYSSKVRPLWDYFKRPPPGRHPNVVTGHCTEARTWLWSIAWPRITATNPVHQSS